jgi:hypothetical protein
MPVVKTGAADRLFGNIEAQGPDQMQPGTGGGAGTGNIAAVLRNLRLHQYHVQQSQFSFRCAAKYSRNFAVRLLSYCMPNFLENQSENTDFYEYFIDYTDWFEQTPFFCEKCEVDFCQISPTSRFRPGKPLLLPFNPRDRQHDGPKKHGTRRVPCLPKQR